jgi:sulfur-carrier protein adenylyltransferase/sulfurtransferase
MLSTEESQRYHRHLIMPEVGLVGQNRLKEAKVLVVGAGGLGCPVLQYLASAGVGKIGIVDFDKVDISNLQRQILYGKADIGKLKTETARNQLLALNSLIDIQLYSEGFHAGNALQIAQEYDLIVDGSDNFATRYLVNDTCVILDKPWVFGAIFKFEGQVSVFNLKNEQGERSATYRCLFPNPPQEHEIPNCAQAGVIGVLPGIIGTMMANEALKIILQIGQPLRNRLLLWDALSLQNRILNIKRIEQRTQIKELGWYENVCKPDKSSEEMNEISVLELKKKLDRYEDWQIIDVREEYEYEICHLTQAELMPMGDIDDYIDQIARFKPVAVYCHHGVRSKYVIEHLMYEYNFTNLYNLQGGIHAWAVEIDETMPTY